jgi:hypothetical protein
MTNEQQQKHDQICGARPDVTFVVTETDGKVLMKGTSKKEDGKPWPTIVIGKGAGIDLLEVRSWSTDKYPKPIDAALVADVLYDNQLTRPARLAAKAAEAAKPTVAGNLPAKEQFVTGEKELTEDEQLERMLAEDAKALTPEAA